MKLIFEVVIEVEKKEVLEHLAQKGYFGKGGPQGDVFGPGTVLQLQDLVDGFEYESEFVRMEK